MPRYNARVDDNQAAIVKGLRDHGASVESLHRVARGCPDLLVGYGGVNYLVEVKDPSKPKADTRLTPRQAEFHAGWRGQIAVAFTIEEALTIIGRGDDQ